ncbi:uncharacterized protein [Dysidea avara]|uniref:uncharacterized protein n=1 Tax=Dysidea avara TaxID=196820 RepID=UPI00331FCA90
MSRVEGHQHFPFGINKDRATEIIQLEVRNFPGHGRSEKDSVSLLWGSMLAKYQLTVFIKSAVHLAKKDLFGLSDPYVKMSFHGSHLKVFPHFTTFAHVAVPENYKTKTIPKTLNPQWNATFKFTISGTEGTIIFDCYDENVLIPDDFLGRVYFTFNLTDPDSLHYFPVQSTGADVGTKEYPLKEKYQSNTENIPHLRNINTYLKSKKRLMKNHKVKGNLIMKIVFEERSRWEDLIEMYGPQMGLPTGPSEHLQSLSLEASSPQHDISDPDDFEELPAGWELRLDSNRRPLFVHHDTRMASLQRPTNEQQQQPETSSLRPFLPRLHSVEEEEEDEEVEDGWLLVGSPTATISQASSDSQQSTQSQTQESTEELPPGWERRYTNDGKLFYIDHNTRSTSWTLPKKQKKKKIPPPPPRRTASMSSSASVQAQKQDENLPPGWETRLTKDGKLYYVDHNTRNTTWVHPNKQGMAQVPLPLGWEARKHSDDRVFYIDHNTKSTQWTDPRLELKNKPTAKIEYDRDYRQKYINFRTKLKQKPGMPKEYRLPVGRTSILEDSFNVIMSVKDADAEKLKSRLYIVFEGESGLDYGGLAREWFYLLSHEMFNPYYGLFEYSASDDYTLQINPDSGFCNGNHLEYFKFVGRVCGMAVYHAKLVDAFFIRPFYKMMLKKKIFLDDMQCVDVEFYNSLKYILDNDPEPLCLQFTTTKDHFGKVSEVELKSGGADIAVTEANKKEYVRLMVRWRFTSRIQPQMNAFLDGFSKLIPLHLIKVFDEKELEYLMGGLSEIDVGDWKRHTDYQDYIATEQPIVWFWKAVETFDNETRARLLQFVTGTSKVPMNGFSELQGSNGPKKFTIKKIGNIKSLPCAHTCFNRIDLPPYKSYYDLKEKLKLAVDNTEGFEIE